MLGSFLKNRYRFIQKLGQGNQGCTYLVETLDDQAHQFFVVKQLQPNYTNCRSQSEQEALWHEALQVFTKEAAALKKVSARTRQVPKVEDYFAEDNYFYIVQEWIQGGAMSKPLSAGTRWQPAETIKFLIEILQPLNFCHQEGVIHRDLQPENLIRRRNGKLTLIDFGSVQEVSQLTLIASGQSQDQPAIGTVGYMPTEQYYGSPVLASDIYAVGAIGIQLLTGCHPQDIPMDRALGIPAWWEATNYPPLDAFAKVLNRMLAARPEARYPNAATALAALQALQSTVPTVAPTAAVGQLVQDRPAATQPRINLSQKMFTFESAKLLETSGKLDEKKSGSLMEDISGWLSGEVSGLLGKKEKPECSSKIATAVPMKKTAGKAKCFLENLGQGVQLEMVAIPAGKFMMGAPETEENSLYNERPQHVVDIPAFYMGRYPVTQAQYRAIMGINPATHKGDRLPIENVSWHDAQQFCRQLSRQTGRQYRLPSEAEWEYACRAGTSSAFCFGEKISPEVANFKQEQASEVGRFPANDFGLSDMHGNVWEWCADHWHNNYEGTPTDGSAAIVPQAAPNSERVLRGGSWFSNSVVCRSAHRYRFASNFHFKDIGFRVVYSFTPRSAAKP